jgi:putative flavoprotein involved in K+ transport
MKSTRRCKSRAVDVLVIGAGHAGLAVSANLTRLGIDHIVFERGEVAQRWRSERWDSLKLLTPNWMCQLPGQNYEGDDPDGFMTKDQLADVIAGYARRTSAPVMTNVDVSMVTMWGEGYRVVTNQGEWWCRVVVNATGAFANAAVPTISAGVPIDIHQITAKDYRNPEQLPEGGVLVVGASATGLQLAEEIQRSGRQVTLAVGEHVRMPRTWRGHDVYWWLTNTGLIDEAYNDVDDIQRARGVPSPQLVGRHGEDLDLNGLQRIGRQPWELRRWKSISAEVRSRLSFGPPDSNLTILG